MNWMLGGLAAQFTALGKMSVIDDGQGNGGERDSLLKKGAYKLAADINVVAIYRLLSGLFGTAILGMLAYFGTNTLTEIAQLRAEVYSANLTIQMLSSRVGGLEASLMMEQRIRERMLDRINDNANRLTILETKMMDMRR